MCGIFAAFDRKGRPFDEELVRSQCRVMTHRGPDDEGYFFEPGLALGMRRLSIVDLAGGKQPISNEDQTVWTVFNGEIYNHEELRRELQAKGHSFSTRTDTEVIVHLYEEMGESFVTRLNGMFGLAVWDAKRRRLVIARDRLGIKPLYVMEREGTVQFASEIKVFLEDPSVERRTNLRALHHYLGYLYVPAPETMFVGINKVPPGHLVVCDEQGLRVERYWDMQYREDKSMTLEDAVEGLREQLHRSVKRRLMADVPLGAYLSGGIDSSVIVALMSEFNPEPVKTFTLGFGDENAEFNELHHARDVAELFGTDHHEFIVREGHVAELLPEVVWHFDEPFGDGLHTYFISQLAKDHVTVALTGLGSDELFAGYGRHGPFKAAGYYRRLPGALRGLVEAAIAASPERLRGSRNFKRVQHLVERSRLSGADAYAREIRLTSEDVRREVYSPSMLEDYGSHDLVAFLREMLEGQKTLSEWERLSYLELKTTMVEDFLNYVDRMGMAHSMELRVPFLDHELVEFVGRMPFAHKLHGLRGVKHVLKRVAEGLLPARIVHRKKMPFFLPLDNWIRNDLREFVIETLSEERLARHGHFDPVGVRRLIDRHLAGQGELGWTIWAILVFQVWHDRFIEGG